MTSIDIDIRPLEAAASAEATAARMSLIDHIIEQSRTDESPPASVAGQNAASGQPVGADLFLQNFLQSDSVAESLSCWLGESWLASVDHSVPEDVRRGSVVRQLSADIALIDQLLSTQLDAILHHPRFQQLEASWLGLLLLVQKADFEADPLVRVKFLNVTWREIEKDLERAIEFDQSQLFKQVYEQEFGSPGGEPFGLLLGDYTVRHQMSPGYATDDVAMLRKIAGIAASAFCPFLCAADPLLLDLQSFSELQVTRDHQSRMSRLDYLNWKTLREEEDSRFLGLLLPRVLMRCPYEDDGMRVDLFPYREDYSSPERSGFLWGNPVYAYATVAIRAFATSGWLADLRGLRQGEDGGGIVTDLPAYDFKTDQPGVAARPVTEVFISDLLEKQLSDLGFLSLCSCKDTNLAVFASGQSLQRHQEYSKQSATANAKISTMLPYVLTVSRFAHYVKILTRNKLGGFATADDLERLLRDWVSDYVTPDRDASVSVKARRPLREAEITVTEIAGRPGNYLCTMRLAPHYELDDMIGSLQLRTTLGS